MSSLPSLIRGHSSWVLPRRKRGGFALLITITLLAFLVLLLVSLASLTRVETQVASNNQSISQARQNALMALNIALGQLQKYTGPDQRVTAASDIASSSDGTRLVANGSAQNTSSVNGTKNGLVSIQAGTRWWTGVWGRSGASYSTPGLSPYEATPSPVLLNWLVSGNEDRTFTVGADGLVATSSADTTSSANTAPFVPGAPVNWSVAGLNTADPASWSAGSAYANLEIKSSGQKAVLLVGPRTAGATANGSEAAVERYVVAPMKNIEVPASSVPGLGSGSIATTVGRYAWWVGDEGVKASYALADPHAGQTDPSSSDEARLRLMTASRSGIELLSGWQDYPAVNDTTAAVKLDRVIDLRQAPMLTPTLLPETQRSAFHDVARLSFGLLTDALNGGLRTDLTYHFESAANWNGSPLKGSAIIPSTWSPDWAAAGYAPKWDLLHSFYTTNPSGSVSNGTLAMRPESSTQVGVGPVITQFRFAVFTDLSGVPNSNVKNVPDGTYTWPVRANVVFVLANPYNFTLTAPAGELEFVVKNTSTRTNTAASEGNTNKLLILAYNWKTQADKYGVFNILRQQDSNEPQGFLDTVKFAAPALSIAPGESVTLSVAGQHQLSGTNAASAEPVNTVQLAVNSASNLVLPIPDNPTPSHSFFTSAQPFTFTTASLTGPSEPYGGTVGRSIVANYAYGNPNIMITLRQTSSGTIYQQIRDIAYTKTGDLGGFERAIMGNIMLKFMAPGFRNITGNPPVSASTGGGDKFLYYLTAQGRVFQDYNIRAAIIDHPNISGTTGVSGAVTTPPPYASGLFNATSTSTISAYFSNNLIPAGWAEDSGADTRDGTNFRNPPASRGVLFDLPRRTTGQLPVLSLGQLQHAALTANDYQPSTSVTGDVSRSARGSIGHQSGYAVGNSYAPPLVARGASVSTRTNTYQKAPAGSSRYFDIGYLLNTALWDGYFFSGITQNDPLALTNPRYAFNGEVTSNEVRSADSAEHLLVKGVFNINSTSKDAWVALLGGLNGLRVNDDLETGGVPYPRTLWQPEHSQSSSGGFQTSGTDNETYAGYRRLTSAEIDRLATEIVKRVRARGPFVSLSHFINRSLVAANHDFNSDINDANTSGNLADPAVPMGRGFSGPLQAAIDSAASGINTFIGTSPNYVVTADGANAYGDRVLFNGSLTPSNTYLPRNDNNGGVYFADMKVDWAHTNWHFDQPAKPGPYGRTSTGTPGWLLQGDLLQALAPALSARSDTFVIRAYGDTTNPATGDVTGRAWCEATVQRMPDYVNAAANPASDKLPALDAVNKQFGRGYKIVGFRWLTAEDI